MPGGICAGRQRIQMGGRALPTGVLSGGASRKNPQFISSAEEGRCGPVGTGLDQACSRAQLSGFGARGGKRGRERSRVGGGRGKLGGAGPGFLEEMVGNRLPGMQLQGSSVACPCLCRSGVRSGLSRRCVSAAVPWGGLPGSAGGTGAAPRAFPQQRSVHACLVQITLF